MSRPTPAPSQGLGPVKTAHPASIPSPGSRIGAMASLNFRFCGSFLRAIGIPFRSLGLVGPDHSIAGMNVRANGRGYEVDRDTTVAQFIRARGLDPALVVVERNGEPLERGRYGSEVLAEGDLLELVRAVAG